MKRIWHSACGMEDVEDLMTWIVQYAALGSHGDFLMQGDWHTAQAMGSCVIGRGCSSHLTSSASEPVGVGAAETGAGAWKGMALSNMWTN